VDCVSWYDESFGNRNNRVGAICCFHVVKAKKNFKFRGARDDTVGGAAMIYAFVGSVLVSAGRQYYGSLWTLGSSAFWTASSVIARFSFDILMAT
jgi:hypothetical protein